LGETIVNKAWQKLANALKINALGMKGAQVSKNPARDLQFNL